MKTVDGKDFYSWEDIGEALDAFAQFYKKEKLQFSGIYAVPRGGLVPGVCLSHKLGLPMLAHHYRNALIVDDISDTGKTLQIFAKKFFIFTLFWHRGNTVKPDFYVYEKRNNWIVFPWET